MGNGKTFRRGRKPSTAGLTSHGGDHAFGCDLTLMPAEMGYCFSADLVAEARDYFEKQYGCAITEKEARRMLNDLTEFMRIIIAWEVQGLEDDPDWRK